MTSTQKVIAFSAVTEFATGVALIAAPVLVGRLLLGEELAGAAVAVARCFGIGLISLSLAVWPDADGTGTRAGARAMLVYNAGLAVYLTWLGAHRHIGGVVLWPAAALHAVVAVLLAFFFRPVNDEA